MKSDLLRITWDLIPTLSEAFRTLSDPSHSCEDFFGQLRKIGFEGNTAFRVIFDLVKKWRLSLRKGLTRVYINLGKVERQLALDYTSSSPEVIQESKFNMADCRLGFRKLQRLHWPAILHVEGSHERTFQIRCNMCQEPFVRLIQFIAPARAWP